MNKVVIIGPAYPLRGGLASFNECLARSFQSQNHEVILYTFSLQYPNFLFPGKTQYSDDPKPTDLDIRIRINSINPINWIKVGLEIKKLKPELVICPFWLPFMGPCLGTILRVIKRNNYSRIISVIHNIIPHERRPGDRIFAQYFLPPVEGFIVMSKSVETEMAQFSVQKPIIYSPHPLYNNYGESMSREEALKKLDLPAEKRYLLFFGFIRDYKGLDLLIKAMAEPEIKELGLKLIVAGEFYADDKKYLDLIEEMKVRDSIILKTEFIPNNEVNQYFCAADLVVQPYKSATQSGISQIAYHFEKPMVVTNVGGLPEIVAHEEGGYVVDVDPKSIAIAVAKFYNENKAASFLEGLRERKKLFSWEHMTNGIKSLLDNNH